MVLAGVPSVFAAISSKLENLKPKVYYTNFFLMPFAGISSKLALLYAPAEVQDSVCVAASFAGISSKLENLKPKVTTQTFF